MVKKKSILCVIVVYNPDLIVLQNNIRHLIDDVTMVMLWQNSRLNDKERRELVSIFDQSKIVFAGNGNNEGIPRALNYAVSHMNEKGYDYLLTMDQDSQWINLSKFISCVDKNNCIYGPQIISNTDTLERKKQDDIQYISVGYLITSGMMCYKDVLSSIGPFNEELFIDAVDEEYCYRGRKLGIKSIQIQGTYLIQQFGDSKEVSFAGKKTIAYNYSAFRYYYIVRNHIYLLRSDLPTRNEKKYIAINYVRSPIVKCLLFENKKAKKIHAILQGVVSGLTMKIPQ